MSAAPEPLTFTAVDGLLGFASSAGHLNSARLSVRYTPHRLGPLLEFLYLVAGNRLSGAAVSNLLAPNGAAPMIAALQEGRERWASSDNRRMGFIRAVRLAPDGDEHLTAFLMDAQRAGRDVAKLPGTTPGQLVAAMQELENNIHEHSEAAETGLLAYRAAPGIFEFVAADRGIGILASLRRSPEFASLTDHGRAIESALADGTSRFGMNMGRGNGFRPIFLGLLNLQGSLRFRSGDHALLMDGTSPQLSTARQSDAGRQDSNHRHGRRWVLQTRRHHRRRMGFRSRDVPVRDDAEGGAGPGRFQRGMESRVAAIECSGCDAGTCRFTG